MVQNILVSFLKHYPTIQTLLQAKRGNVENFMIVSYRAAGPVWYGNSTQKQIHVPRKSITEPQNFTPYEHEFHRHMMPCIPSQLLVAISRNGHRLDG